MLLLVRDDREPRREAGLSAADDPLTIDLYLPLISARKAPPQSFPGVLILSQSPDACRRGSFSLRMVVEVIGSPLVTRGEIK
jgi:hypothetical protein